MQGNAGSQHPLLGIVLSHRDAAWRRPQPGGGAMLARIKGMSRGSWIAIGLLAGVIVAPGVALAAFSDFRIVGVNGTPVAQVTPANQLRTAEADPASSRMLYVPAPSQNTCVPSQQIPGGSAFVLKQAQFDAYSVPAIGPGNSVSLYEGPTCAG